MEKLEYIVVIDPRTPVGQIFLKGNHREPGSFRNTGHPQAEQKAERSNRLDSVFGDCCDISISGWRSTVRISACRARLNSRACCCAIRTASACSLRLMSRSPALGGVRWLKDVRSQTVTCDATAAIVCKRYGQLGLEFLTNGQRLAQITNTGPAETRVLLLFRRGEAVEVCAQFFHCANVPSGTYPVKYPWEIYLKVRGCEHSRHE